MKQQYKISDDEILEKLGIKQDINGELKKALVESFYENIEAKFGVLLGQVLTDDQVDEFIKLQDSGCSTEELDAWIVEKVPQYDELRQAVIKDSLDEMKSQLDKMIPKQ